MNSSSGVVVTFIQFVTDFLFPADDGTRLHGGRQCGKGNSRMAGIIAAISAERVDFPYRWGDQFV